MSRDLPWLLVSLLVVALGASAFWDTTTTIGPLIVAPACYAAVILVWSWRILRP